MSNIYWEEHNMPLVKVDKDYLLASNVAKNVGGYDITGNSGKENSIVFVFTKKPSWLHRKLVKILLGWTWIDKIY